MERDACGVRLTELDERTCADHARMPTWLGSRQSIEGLVYRRLRGRPAAMAARICSAIRTLTSVFAKPVRIASSMARERPAGPRRSQECRINLRTQQGHEPADVPDADLAEYPQHASAPDEEFGWSGLGDAWGACHSAGPPLRTRVEQGGERRGVPPVTACLPFRRARPARSWAHSGTSPRVPGEDCVT